MSYKYRVRGTAGDIVAYTDTINEANQVIREDGGGTIELNPIAQHAPIKQKNPWEPAEVTPDIRSLEGPFTITSGTIKGINMTGQPIYFDQERNSYYSPKLGAYLNVDVPPTPTPEPSARTIEAAKITKKIQGVQSQYNQFVRDGKKATPEARKTAKKLQKLQADLDRVKPPPVDLPLPPAEKFRPPKSPRGRLAMRFKWDGQRGLIKVYFDPKSDLAPVAEAALRPYALAPLTQGQLGYWAFHEDDLADVMKLIDAKESLVYDGDPRSPTGIFKELAKKLEGGKRLSKKAASIKLAHAPKFPPIVGDTPAGKKFPYQEEGIRFLMSRDRALLADDMGLGKTYQAIVAAQTIVPAKDQILIMCPAAVVGNWKDDIEKFIPGIPAVVLTETERLGGEDTDPNVVYPGNYAAKIDGLPPLKRARFVVCSYDALANRRKNALVREYALDTSWGCVIVDEAHRAKKVESLANQFLQVLKTKKLWLLTGTPVANRPVDLFGQLVLLQHPLGDDKGRFMKKFTIKRVGGGDGFEGVATNIEMLPLLGKQISGTVLRRTKQSALLKKLPAKMGGLASGYGKITVPLPEGIAGGDLASVPDRMNAGVLSKLRTLLAKAKVPYTWEVAEKVLAAGEKVIIFTGFTAAMKEFEELCDQARVLSVKVDGTTSLTGKSVAAALFQRKTLDTAQRSFAIKHYGSWFLKLLDRAEYASWTKKELAEATKRFGRDRSTWPHTVAVFLGQMVSASEGITLTAADVLLFNDLDWMPTRHQQAEDRIYRLASGGQSHDTVYIGYILSDSWLDDFLLVQLIEKAKEIDDVYSGVSGSPNAVSKRMRADFNEMVKMAQIAATKTKKTKKGTDAQEAKQRKKVAKMQAIIAKNRAQGRNAIADRLERQLLGVKTQRRTRRGAK